MQRSYVAMMLMTAVSVALASLVLVHLLPPLIAAENYVEDFHVAHLSPAERQHDGIAVVAIGDAQLSRMACRSPIDRRVLADLIEVLIAKQVRAIGVDILFDQPTWPDQDDRLRKLLLHAEIPIVAISVTQDTPLSAFQHAFLEQFLAGVPTGYANIAKDGIDHRVRWHYANRGGELSFPARIAELLDVPVLSSRFRIAWRSRTVNNDPPFPIFHADAVEHLPASWLAGRIVLIGVIAADTDRHQSPVSIAGGAIPGVLVQAHVLSQLLDGRHANIAPLWISALLVLLLALAGVAVAHATWPVWGKAAVALLVLLVIWVVAPLSYANGGPLLPLLAPSLAWLASIALVTAYLTVRTHRERAVLMRLFARHVSAPVAADMWRDRETFMAGRRPRPQHLVASILFSDLEGFTTIAERLPPDELMRWLEDYMEAMVRIVGAHDGIVLRFIGDAILAAFGVPAARHTDQEIDRDAQQAVRCALAMERELDRLNRQYRERDLPMIRARIGIHTGRLIAGSLGHEEHMEYSLVGDTVNTAARLEALGKEIDRATTGSCTIIAGDETVRRIGAMVASRSVGNIRLKGKQDLVAAFEILPAAPVS